MPAKPTAETQRKEAAFIPRAPVQPGETARREPEKGANTMDAMSEAAVVNAGRSTKKRAPSLFERMTGTGRARQNEDEAPAKTASTAARPPSKKAMAAPAPKAEVSSPPATREPTLDMAAKQPATPVASTPASDEEDPLEIPAFLRRQAN
jgi:cell division protein FtsZ